MRVLKEAPVHLALLCAVLAATAILFWLKPEWAVFPVIGLVPSAVLLARKLGFEPVNDPAAKKERKTR